jgi:formylglycine-generating enzyme required for sulfatase activity/uncharacterized caspase-like protein
MAQNWAIAIGINQYEFLQPLRYAKRDAEVMRMFLENEAGFDRVLFFTDDSPAIGGKSTKPFGSNILRVLRQVFDRPFMGDGDNFWFFFSGHGIRHHDRDYLMPMDGDPEDVERTGIATTYITERLRRCGADNVVMILDACRSEGRKSGVGIGHQTEEEARQTGVISIFSCSPEQYSYEIQAVEQGAFTAALLEGLGIRGRCATVERLNQYLETRVPEIVNQHLKRVRQVPYAIAEPLSRSHLILMPQYASLADIAILKNDAFLAERRKDWDLAQRLWIRVLAAASGQDMDAIASLQHVAVLRATGQVAAPLSPSPPSPSPSKSSTPSSQFQLFSFDVVQVNAQGKESQRSRQQAQYFAENLGNGTTLEMVQIPGGTFMMGSPEGKGDNDERPQHSVTVKPFFIGKFPITQAQYEAVMGNNPATQYDSDRFVAPDKPVVGVSWHDAIAFCERLSQQTKTEYRLPSEAEWEYACRAGTETPFHFGETITTDLANYNGNYTYGSAPKGEYRKKPTPVGSFPANAFGLFDMHGNVWEWCLDHWHENYQDAPTDGSAWIKGGDESLRLLRGGSWFNFPGSCRSAYRDWDGADLRYDGFGFRVVCSAPRSLP